MKLTRLTKSTGQVSLEALILWAGVAAVLALLLPVFTTLVHAQSARVDVANVHAFSQTLSSRLTSFAFLSSGSRESFLFPVEKNFSINVENDSILVSYFVDGMESPHEETISSLVSLEYEPLLENTPKIVLTRTPNGITIQFADTFLP